MLSKQMLKELRADINQALESVGKKHNVTMRAANASFDPQGGTAQFKLEIVELGEQGAVRDIPAELFLTYADVLGLKKEHLHKEITLSDRKYKVTGYNPKARKNCITILDSVANKTYVTTVDIVRRKLEGV